MNKKMKKLMVSMLVLCVMLMGKSYDIMASDSQLGEIYDEGDFETLSDYNQYMQKRGLMITNSRAANSYYLASVRKTTAIAEYSLEGLLGKKGVQNFCINDEKKYIYVTQQSQGTISILKMKIDQSTKKASYESKMTLNKCGHGQTLEIYKYNGKTYLLVSSKENKISDSTYWSVQVARVEYQANKTYNYTSLHRLTYINYANKAGSNGNPESIGTLTRCDAALSTDSKYIIIWAKAGSNLQYSCYDFTEVNKALDKEETVSCKSNSILSKALKYYFIKQSDETTYPQKSFQGIELTNGLNIYQSSGKDNLDNCIANISKSGNWKSTAVISVPRFNDEKVILNKSNVEIEGIKIRGSKLFFATIINDGSRNSYIYSIDKSVMD